MAFETSSERTRSPRAPKHALPQAIAYAKMIYDSVHRSAITSTMAYELMGFIGKNGASASALGSVRQFGLIDGTGDRTRISDLALTIFEPASADERSDAIGNAAKHPEIFQEIRSRFSDRIPSSDDPIRAYLIRERGFLKSGADETIKSLRDTEQYVIQSQSQRAPAPTFADQDESDAEISQQSNEPAQTTQSKSTYKEASHDVRVAVTKDCVVELKFHGEITEKAVTNLIRYVELMKDVLTDRED